MFCVYIVVGQVDSTDVRPTRIPRRPNPNECKTNNDCNDGSTPTRACKPGFKNMTTECECIKEQYTIVTQEVTPQKEDKEGNNQQSTPFLKLTKVYHFLL